MEGLGCCRVAPCGGLYRLRDFLRKKVVIARIVAYLGFMFVRHVQEPPYFVHIC